MKRSDINAALTCAEAVSRKVGVFLKGKLRSHKRINQQTAHDIKLELDDRSQRMIERQLLKVFPEVAILGEEEQLRDRGIAIVIPIVSRVLNAVTIN